MKKKFNTVFAQLEYFNNHNVLVYYRNNFTRNDFVKVNDELYKLIDHQEFNGLIADVEIQLHSYRLRRITHAICI